jgi:hypothetical protein
MRLSADSPRIETQQARAQSRAPLEAKMLNGNTTDQAGAAGATDAASGAGKPKTAKPKAKPAKPQRETSTILFPYRDLEIAISVAQAMIEAGGVALTTDQLAGVMKLQAGSGNFVMKVATARIFGLVVNTGGKYELTDTGFAVVDKNEVRSRAARAEAFLKVPLYKRTYDEFRGKQLPPRPLGLEQAFVRFGVSAKQKEAARLAFDRSATQAGFYANGNDRLVEPIIAGGLNGRGSGASEQPMPPAGASGGGGSDAPMPAPAPMAPAKPALPPFIQGLLDSLPEPNTNWTVEGRAKWLQAAARCFDLMYKGSGEVQVQAIPAPDNPTPDKA